MRVELRAEVDGHDYEASVECDRSVPLWKAVEVAGEAVRALYVARADDGTVPEVGP